MGIGELAAKILAVVLEILATVLGIQGILLEADLVATIQAIKSSIDTLINSVGEALTFVSNNSLKLDNINNKLDALQNSVNGVSLTELEFGIAQDEQYQSISYQLAHPITPPAPAGDIASEVWNFIQGGEDRPMGYFQIVSGKVAINLGDSNAQLGSQGSPLVGVTAFWDQAGPQIQGESAPHPNLNAIGSYSTVLAWLNGTSGRTDWTLNPQGYYWCEADLGTSAFSFWVCRLSQWEFDFLKGIPPSSALVAAPVWPGLANVTLGSVLTLTDGMTVPGPLDGLIVDITAVAPPTGFYGFGSRKSYVHIGAVVFISDNGDAEHSETIGLDRQVIAAKGMTRAASAVMRVKSGTVGTVQPWTITA